MPACNYQLKLPKQTNKRTNEGKKWWQIIRAYLYIRLSTCVRIYLIFFCTRFGIISADPHNLHIKNTITQIWWNLNAKQRAEGKSKYWVDRTLGCRDWCQLFFACSARTKVVKHETEDKQNEMMKKMSENRIKRGIVIQFAFHSISKCVNYLQ